MPKDHDRQMCPYREGLIATHGAGAEMNPADTTAVQTRRAAKDFPHPDLIVYSGLS